MSRRSPTLVATYRIQLGPTFGFDAAAGLVPHILALGVSHLYLSPILEAGRGSTHGYDVVDHAHVSDALGGRSGFERLVAAAHAHGLGIVLDIVPNHMSIADERNRWWWDVLENGPSARAAEIFDVDWDAPTERLKNIVLVPILGEHRGAVLARNAIRVAREGARFFVRYEDHCLPVSPRTLDVILAGAFQRTALPRLAFLADAFAELPLASVTDRVSVERRHRDRAILGELLAEVLAAEPAARAVDDAVAALNADLDALDAFLDRQNYRLTSWRAARRDLDYRRFFDINTLVGLHVEDERVFRATHAFLGELVESGFVDGLRVDYLDGLADPATYLARLRTLAGARPIWVEKVLALGEMLPTWPIEGTTGYDFIGVLDALFVDPAGRERLEALTGELTGESRSFTEIAAEAREDVLRDVLDAELQRLTALATTVAARRRETRDLTRGDLHDALRAVAAAFPRYRSYIDASRRERSDDDERAIATALRIARARHPAIDPEAFSFVEAVLSLRFDGDDATELVRRFQQFTPSATAKGVEDTAFYRDGRLVAMNEVGGAPNQTIRIDDFHTYNLVGLECWPDRMLTTSTHDTKRSEDARARGLALAEDPDAYAALARAFFRRADSSTRKLEPRLVLFALDALIAAWPLDEQRFAAFVQKAAREAKVRTSWTRPATEYETLIQHFTGAVLRDPELCALLEAFVPLLDRAAHAISLAWTLLKITSPGVPDFYQGCERFHHSLVDPDNRRAVDWSLVARDSEKTKLIRAALAHRRAHRDRFGRGAHYEPLAATGDGADHVIAFLRRGGDRRSLTVVVRWPRSFAAKRARTRVVLPGTFRNVLVRDRRVRGEITLDALLGDTAAGLFEEEHA